MAEKPDDNKENKYDHNFEGKWCICNAKYDPNYFMIRCLDCLDYFHLYHLNISERLVDNSTILIIFQQNAIEDNDVFNVMLCGKCVANKYKFLLCYKNDKNIAYKEEEIIALSENQDADNPKEIIHSNSKVLLGKRTRSLEEACLVKETLEAEYMDYKDDICIFLKDSWQNYLCYCDECQKIYKDNGVYELLTAQEENPPEPDEDEEEKLNSQENHVNTFISFPQNLQSTAESNATLESNYENSIYGKAMKEMSKLDYMTQTQIAAIYRDFYDDFNNYFAKFKEEGKVITADNVQEFFEYLKEKKKDVVYDQFKLYFI